MFFNPFVSYNGTIPCACAPGLTRIFITYKLNDFIITKFCKIGWFWEIQISNFKFKTMYIQIIFFWSRPTNRTTSYLYHFLQKGIMNKQTFFTSQLEVQCAISSSLVSGSFHLVVVSCARASGQNARVARARPTQVFL